MKSVAWDLLVGIFVALSLSFAPHAAAQWIQDGICVYPAVSDEEYTPVCMAYDGSGAVVLVCGRSSINTDMIRPSPSVRPGSHEGVD